MNCNKPTARLLRVLATPRTSPAAAQITSSLQTITITTMPSKMT